jgi:hypothetical protein
MEFMTTCAAEGNGSMASGEGPHRLPTARGTVVLSIDLELDLEHTEPGLTRRLDNVRSQLLEQTAKWNVPVTWAVADPMLSAATEPILRAGGDHEIAVLGERAWLGPGCGRDRLARELGRRFSAPRKTGMAVQTLLIRNVEQVNDVDLLIEHGVRAISTPPADAPPAPQRSLPIRFGIWQPPTAWRLAAEAPWWSPTAWQVRRRVQRAARLGGLVHLRIDALGLVDAPRGAAPLVQWLFAFLGRTRDTGRIQLATIAALATAALSQRAGSPSRSVLRPAA